MSNNTIISNSDCCVLIFTYNSEVHIEECIRSAKLLTNTVGIIDMESTDNTKTIVAKHQLPLFTFQHTDYVEPARSFGMSKARGKWVFILDDDERITKELANEIKEIIHQDAPYNYYKVPRKDYFARKKWLQYGGWWPNYQTRLIKLEAFKQWPTAIHSTPIIEGNFGLLKNALIHYSKNDYTKIVEKTLVFENTESDLLFQANKPVTTITFFRKFLGELYRRLIKQQSFRDGKIGIIESLYQAFSKTITYLFLYEKKKSRSI